MTRRLGATLGAGGMTVRVFSANATAMTLCLFENAHATRDTARVPMQRDGDEWVVSVPGAGPGTIYALRADGPWSPATGQWFDPSRLLFDPYGRAFAEPFSWSHSRHPRAVAISDQFDWAGDVPPRTAWTNSLIYEAHVKGFTERHPDIPTRLRGTYAGLAAEPAINHLRALGVTAVQLLPVHARVDERALSRRGLTNYWGYNTLGFFAPEPRLAAARTPQGVVDEFKTMVRALHAAGIEVILDVVYNHTAEGDHIGSTMAFRGLDNHAYYRLRDDDASRYADVTGCGNTLDTRKPAVRRLILDSLRYWVEQMHVDGFRFDLASALARTDAGVDPDHGVIADITSDPVLSQVKLIAEPWDATAEGYALGRFPRGWAEWNGRYRDDVRRYWNTDRRTPSVLTTRLAGSSDVFSNDRGPIASINFVTSHDGFTLADLVSYRDKHNLANGEDNRDGESHNLSDNFGVEGPASDAGIRAARSLRQRAFFQTLFASLGVPMISGGDELGRSQLGNNNAYCQDSPLSWTPWTADDGADLALLEFVQALSAWRRDTPAVRRATFLTTADVQWLHLDYTPLEEHDWHATELEGFIMRLSGPPPVDIVIHRESIVPTTRTSETPAQQD